MALTVTQASDSISRVEQIFFEAVLRAVTFDSTTGIRQIQGTRDKFSMWEGSTTDNIVQSYATAPSEVGTISAADTEFTIDKKSINVAVPYDSLKNTVWKDAIENIHEMGLPAELQNAMVANITEKALKEVEAEIWTSNAGATGDPSGTINGFIKQISDKLTAASLTGQIISGANSFTDKSTIQGLMEAMIDVMPTALLDNQNGVKFFVSPATAFAYRRSLETQAAAVMNDQSPVNFGGFEVQVIPNLNSRWMALGKPENLGVGMPSSPNDIISLRVNDQTENNKNQANIFGNFGYGAGIVTTDWVISQDTTA